MATATAAIPGPTSRNRGRNVDTEKLQDNSEINLGELLSHFRKYLRRYWLLVLLTGLVCAAIFAAVSFVTFSPVYEAKAMFTVSADSSASDISS